VEHNFPKIGEKIMFLNARRIPASGEHPNMILLAIEDVTAQEKIEETHKATMARVQKELEEARRKA
jgi:hypothetical protein